jgi:hypothetical protein
MDSSWSPPNSLHSKIMRRNFTPRAYPPKASMAARLMIWGSLSVLGPGMLYHVNGSMNSTQYCDMLDTHLLPQASAWFGNSPWIYQQDFAPCHTSRISTNHMHNRGISVLPWPCNSPDMNPIEMAWALLKKELRTKKVSKEELWERCNEVWHSSETIRQFCISVPSSMCKRVRQLISRKGGHTDF